MLKESSLQVIGRVNVNEILLCALQDMNVPVWHVSRLKRDACKMPDYAPSELRRLKSPAIYLAGRSCGLLAKRSPSNVDAFCGEGGIRTHDTVASIPPFQGGQINRSCTSPVISRKIYQDLQVNAICGAHAL